jgi:hypothetical protein
MNNALYLFCLARSHEALLSEGDGVGCGGPLVQEDFRDVTAVACTVPLEDFVGSSADERLQDLAWVAPRALRHEQVIEEVMRHSPVLPARFGTLFSSRESLLALVENNYAKIDQFLDYVKDKEEWAVKCLLSRSDAMQSVFAEQASDRQSELDSMPPGLRYFKKRQMAAEAEKGLNRWLSEVCKGVAQQLASIAADSSKRSISQALEDKGMEVVANWAFLINEDAVQNFETSIARINGPLKERGLFFKCSGPWPPYTFSPALEMVPIL